MTTRAKDHTHITGKHGSNVLRGASRLATCWANPYRSADYRERGIATRRRASSRLRLPPVGRQSDSWPPCIRRVDEQPSKPPNSLTLSTTTANCRGGRSRRPHSGQPVPAGGTSGAGVGGEHDQVGSVVGTHSAAAAGAGRLTVRRSRPSQRLELARPSAGGRRHHHGKTERLKPPRAGQGSGAMKSWA